MRAVEQVQHLVHGMLMLGKVCRNLRQVDGCALVEFPKLGCGVEGFMGVAIGDAQEEGTFVARWERFLHGARVLAAFGAQVLQRPEMDFFIIVHLHAPLAHARSHVIDGDGLFVEVGEVAETALRAASQPNVVRREYVGGEPLFESV